MLHYKPIFYFLFSDELQARFFLFCFVLFLLISLKAYDVGRLSGKGAFREYPISVKSAYELVTNMNVLNHASMIITYLFYFYVC